MIDISKIKVGDEVTIRAKVVGVRTNYLEVVFSAGQMLVPNCEIVTHTPSPREFKPGDVVFIEKAGPYEFIAIRDGLACAWNNKAKRFDYTLLHRLRHADESE